MTSSLSDELKGLQLDAKSTESLYYRLAPRAEDLASKGCGHGVVYDTEEKLMGHALQQVICFIRQCGQEGTTLDEIVEGFRDRSFFDGKTDPLFARTNALFDYVLTKLPEILALLTEGEVVEIFRKEKKEALSKT